MDSSTENIGVSVDLGGKPAEKQVREPIKRIESALLGHANGRWEEAKQSHNLIEEKLLESLRRRRGVYADSKLKQIQKQGGSEIYMQITGIKCRAASAWIKNVMLQPGERVFSIDPTPVPDKAESVDVVVKQLMMQAQQQGVQADPEDVKKLVEDQSAKALKERTDKMADKIQDQLVEGGFYEALNEYIDDLCTFQSAFLKGPILRKKIKEHWVQGESGAWQLSKEPELVLEWERVSPFDIFPAPDATDINESWLIERHRVSRSELRSYIGMPGFDSDAINDVLLRYYASGRDEYVTGDQNKERLETTTSNQAYQTETIAGYELWDSVSGEMLIRWDGGRGILGDTKLDKYAEYDVNVWVIGHKIVKVDIADDSSLSRNYYSSSYDTVPGSLWGNSIPEIMSDIQDVCNGCARALVNNMAIASGPQVGINVDKIPAGEVVTAMHPWKYWQFNGDMSGAITFFNPPSHAEELMRIYEYFSSKADEYTGIPAFAYGQSDARGAGSTASGLSMLMSNASNGIKAVIGNIDRSIERAIRTMYNFNMMHSNDDSIKGDAQIVSMGAKSLMVKEQMQQKRMEFMQATLNPVDMQILGETGRAELLRESAKALDLPHNLIPDDKDIQARVQAQQAKDSNAAK